METRKIKGIWWIDNNPEFQLNGILEFHSPKNCYLILDGSFSERNLELIKGFSSKGKSITLYKCFQTNLSESFPGLSTSKYYVNYAFINVDYKTTEDITFKNFSVNFSSLDEWANISGFKIVNEHKKKSVKVIYKKPKDVIIYQDNRFKICLSVTSNGPQINSVQKDVSINQTTFFNVAFKVSEEKLSKVIKISSILQNFLTFAVSKPVKVISLIGQSDKSITSFEDITFNNNIDILYTSITQDLDVSYLDPHFMLFTYPDIKSKSQSLLKKWFQKSETLDPVFSLYFSTLYKIDTFLNLRFLSLVQAIEAYHRRTTTNVEIDIREHNKRLNEIFSNVSKKHNVWLEQKLKYSNEPSLRQRLKSIFNKYNIILTPLINKTTFINDVVNTRNYNVHYDEQLKDNAKRGKELLKICDVLKVIIELCFLTEMGFSETQYSPLIEKSYAYKNITNT